MSTRSGWREFRERWGGTWGVRWDERNGSPRFVWVPGLESVWADDLAMELAALAGVESAQLVPRGAVQAGSREILRWERQWQGAPVVGDEVALVVVAGRIAGAWVRLTQLPRTLEVHPGEVVFALPEQGRGVPAVRQEQGHVVRYLGRDGRVLY
ncbi:MAG: hypothetical protein QGG40_17880, partial [Myxococcota bacterium]|nr:hypothetical protein [Myxococcota bacterium]